MKKKIVMIIAGETSGDHHAAHLVKEMRKIDDSIVFFGIGGNAMEDAGVKIFFHASKISVVGITEVFSIIFEVFKCMKIVKHLLKKIKPDLLILLDFPDFNLQVAKNAKKNNVPVLYYISPQIWAWRSGRIKTIKERIDHMAVILPFEEDYYTKHNVPATFVGHPLLDNTISYEKKTDNNEFTVIGLLPGSRESEIAKHLLVMLESAEIISKKIEKIKFIIPIAPSLNVKIIEDLVNMNKQEATIHIEPEGIEKVFQIADLVITASGTVTLEAAMAGIPMVIIYKISYLSYVLGKALIKVKNISLVNLIARRQIVPELLQDQAEPENIASKVCEILKDQSKLKKMKYDLSSIKNILGTPGASERCARIAIKILNKK